MTFVGVVIDVVSGYCDGGTVCLPVSGAEAGLLDLRGRSLLQKHWWPRNYGSSVVKRYIHF